MKKIRDVLRLTHAVGLSRREVSEATGVSKSSVGDYIRRAETAGLGWPLPEGLDDVALAERLFPVSGEGARRRAEPDWADVHQELQRRGVTLVLLWQEYQAEHPGGYSYSRFCEFYTRWRRRLSATMRQTHLAGEKLFVDWAGDTIPVFDAATGEERRAHIFVAALGASNYTYAEACWTETLSDWIGAHVHAFSALGGVPKAIVPDNLKAGITKPSRHEPGINRTYQDLADHYGTVVLPARPRRPRDKAKVEVAVLIVERFVMAKLRKQQFFSLMDLNAAIRVCVAEINAKVMKRIGKSRAELLELVERPALKALPDAPYEYAEWKRCGVAPDYHVEICGHYYSVPFRLIGETVEARITASMVEIFHKSQRVACHIRSAVHHRHTTVPDHMPSAHRRYAEWTPQRMMREAACIGPATVALFEAILRAKPHPEQGFRSCLGILGLAKSYGAERLEAACKRGNDIGAASYGSIASILKHGLERAYLAPDHASRTHAHPDTAPDTPPIRHGNIRGPGYYH